MTTHNASSAASDDAGVTRIAVLGCGRVGHAMARDLAFTLDGQPDPQVRVTAVDARDAALDRLGEDAGDADSERPITRQTADLGDRGAVARIAAAHDLIVGAAPSHLGLAILQTVIDARRPMVDISFLPENPLPLDALAKAQGATIVVDAGVAPGMSNFILGRARADFASVERFACYVGGLPVARRWPWQYTAPFAPTDVIEEYTRPARFRQLGADVTHPPLTDPEYLEVPGIGTLEAFLTDGLRTVLDTVDDVPDMVEKTLRYPGHREQMMLLRDGGFFGDTPVTLADGATVRPIDLTAALLVDQWQTRPDDAEFTYMRCDVDAIDASEQRVRRTVAVLDHGQGGTSSMARTTGYAATALVAQLRAGAFGEAGVWPLETLPASLYAPVLDYLDARGVRYETVETTASSIG